jgi:uncharacterized protein YndB with AHSA1/START domain
MGSRPARTSFSTEIAMAAPPAAVWSALSQSGGRRRWLNDATATRSWAPGDPIAIDVALERREWHDCGTVLQAVPGKLLSYSLWNEASRRSDVPEPRSVVTFRLAPGAGGGTNVELEHAGLTCGAAGPHASFFWPAALRGLRDQVEGRPPALALGFDEARA